MQDSFTRVVGQYKLDSMFFCVLLYYLFIYLLVLGGRMEDMGGVGQDERIWSKYIT